MISGLPQEQTDPLAQLDRLQAPGPVRGDIQGHGKRRPNRRRASGAPYRDGGERPDFSF